MGRKYLVRDSAGFIGSNSVHWVLDDEGEATGSNLDAMAYVGGPTTVAERDEHSCYTSVRDDIRDSELVDQVVPGRRVIVHFAAESHVDRSIGGPSAFLETTCGDRGHRRCREPAQRAAVHSRVDWRDKRLDIRRFCSRPARFQRFVDRACAGSAGLRPAVGRRLVEAAQPWVANPTWLWGAACQYSRLVSTS